jgi:hypothetical protein
MVVYQVIMYKKYNLNSIHQLHNYDLRKTLNISMEYSSMNKLPFLLITSGATMR